MPRIPPMHEPRRAGPSRRSFLSALPGLGALAAVSAPSDAQAVPSAPDHRHDPVYRDTDHVRSFYDRARF